MTTCKKMTCKKVRSKVTILQACTDFTVLKNNQRHMKKSISEFKYSYLFDVQPRFFLKELAELLILGRVLRVDDNVRVDEVEVRGQQMLTLELQLFGNKLQRGGRASQSGTSRVKNLGRISQNFLVLTCKFFCNLQLFFSRQFFIDKDNL